MKQFWEQHCSPGEMTIDYDLKFEKHLHVLHKKANRRLDAFSGQGKHLSFIKN